MKLIIGFIFTAFFVSQVHAIGSVSLAKVVSVRVDNNGRAMIFFDKPIGGTPPSCVHSAYKSAFGIDAGSEGGKAVLSMALTAKATGSPVTVYGLGVCGVYGGSIVETWNYGHIY